MAKFSPVCELESGLWLGFCGTKDTPRIFWKAGNDYAPAGKRGYLGPEIPRQKSKGVRMRWLGAVERWQMHPFNDVLRARGDIRWRVGSRAAQMLAADPISILDTRYVQTQRVDFQGAEYWVGALLWCYSCESGETFRTVGHTYCYADGIRLGYVPINSKQAIDLREAIRTGVVEFDTSEHNLEHAGKEGGSWMDAIDYGVVEQRVKALEEE